MLASLPFPTLGRPRLLPEVALAWRGPTTVQLGIDEVHARMFLHVTAREARALRQLDGTRGLARVLADHVAEDGSSAWLSAAIDDLHGAGLLVDAAEDDHATAAGEQARLAPDLAAASLLHPGRAQQVLARRRAATVLVRGTGRVGVGVSTLLAAAGVGTVRVAPMSGDAPRVQPRTLGPLGPYRSSLGSPAQSAARAALSGASLAVATGRAAAGRSPDLIVVCPPRVVSPRTSERLADSDVPVLAAVCEGAVARVGPLALPGRTACLRCLDLHRADRDPGWPLVVSQVAHQRTAHHTATDTTLAALTSATAALHALQVIDDPAAEPPPSAGALLELRLPGLLWSRRPLPAHPDCGCTQQAA